MLKLLELQENVSKTQKLNKKRQESYQKINKILHY